MDEDNILDVQQPFEAGDVSSISDETDTPNDNEIEVYALGSGTYGTISDTYLDYFEGIIQKLSPDEHYVIWKSGDYSYTLAYGEDIAEEDGIFTGGCDVVQIYRDSSSNYNSNWYVEYSSDSLNLNTSQLFVYSDLGMYSTVERGFSSLEADTILFAVGFAVVFSICHDIFDYVLGHLRR